MHFFEHETITQVFPHILTRISRFISSDYCLLLTITSYFKAPTEGDYDMLPMIPQGMSPSNVEEADVADGGSRTHKARSLKDSARTGDSFDTSHSFHEGGQALVRIFFFNLSRFLKLHSTVTTTFFVSGAGPRAE